MREVLVGDVDKNVARFLTSMRDSDAGYVDLLCTDRDGRVVAATDPLALNQGYADAAWQRAAMGGGAYLAGPIRPTVGAAPVMEFAAPIPAPEASGDTIGVLRVRYDLNRATKLMHRIRRSSEILRLSVQVLVLDADGVVIVEALGPGQRPLLGENLRALGWRVAQPGAIAAHPRFVREGRARALVGLTPVATPGLGWVVLVMEPVHAAYAPVYRLQRRLGLLLLAVLLAGAGVAVIVAERMSGPLRELTSATQEIVRVGEARQTVPVRSHDEIGQLADAFNTMAGQLKQAEDHLVEAAKFAFVGEVAAGVAHEVRTPLGILRSAAQILGRSLPAERPESAELIDMIIGEVDRLDRVVAGLLDLARPHEPIVEPTSLAAILTRALEFIELQAREKGVAVHRVLDAALPPARCDPEQIYQVALNLLVNALQLVPTGGTVTVRTRAAGPGRVGLRSRRRRPGHRPRRAAAHLRAVLQPASGRYRTRFGTGAAHRPGASWGRDGGERSRPRDDVPRRIACRRGDAMTRVLVVDDERKMRRVLQILIEQMGLESVAVDSAEAALSHFDGEKIDLVLTDLRLPAMSGVELLGRIRAFDPDVPVIVLTAHGTIATAVEAMKHGAFDYVLKPFDVQAVEQLIRNALDMRRFRTENRFLKAQAGTASAFENLIGTTPAMRAVYELIQQVAPTKTAVLITGETGTGKELVARAIHNLSPRVDKLFVPVNCAAIPGELLESELFGHVRGAFTGAQAERTGKFEFADAGTLFLDEIGDMAYPLQAKLLRVLQEGVVERVGSNKPITLDVRVVSSTNRDLAAAIRAGTFREDLYYRLNVFNVHLPPLRERREDIPLLAASFLRTFGEELGKRALGLGADAEPLLLQYDWPGNVRELRNLMERAAVLCRGAEVDAALVRQLLPAVTADATPPAEPQSLELEPAVADLERKQILRALAAAQDNKAEAARLLGVSERTLWYKLKRLGL